MTPQELRLGNLIQFENKTLKVATIGTEFCVLSDGTNTYDAWYDEVQPIFSTICIVYVERCYAEHYPVS